MDITNATGRATLKTFIIGAWRKVDGTWRFVTIAEVQAKNRAEAKRIHKALGLTVNL